MTRDSAFRTSSPSDRSDDRSDGRPNGAARRPARERRSPRDHAARRPDIPSKGAGPAAGVSADDAAALLPRERTAHFREAALFYDPPYASPLADRLARQLVRHLKPSCGLQHETVALTPRNCFRLDFLIETGGDVRGIERAGLLLGERPEAEGAPNLYDALVVGSGAVDVLYRFDPEGLDTHLADALFLMGEHDRALFEQPERLRARAAQGACAGTLRGPEVRLSYPSAPVEVCSGEIPQRPEERPDLVMRRLSAAAPAAWAADYRRALTHFRVPQSQWRNPEALRRRAQAA